MKKTRIIILIILIIILFFVFRDGSEQTELTGEPIKIGAVLPLTGNLAKVGEDVRAALSIAQEDLMETYPNVEIIYEDDAFNPKLSVDVFNKLMTTNQVDAIIGPLNGSSISAVRPLAEQHQIVAFTPWGAGNRIENFTIKNSVEADDEARVLADYATEKLGLKKLAIIYLNNDWGLTHLEAFKDQVTERGAELVVSESFEFGSNDYRTQLAKAITAEAEGLFIVHNGAQVAVIARQAGELGFEGQLFGQYATESSDLIDTGGDSLEGLIYTFPINEANLSKEQRHFIGTFEEQVGGKPQVAAYNAYDIYTILVPLIVECDGGGTCVRDRILSTRNFEGVGGSVSFIDGKLKRDFFLKTIRNGTITNLEQ